MEENDHTGDSGIGTGSGTAQYGTHDEWRNALKNPPPGKYQYMCSGTSLIVTPLESVLISEVS